MYAVPVESTATAGCEGKPCVFDPIVNGLLIASALAENARTAAPVVTHAISDRPKALDIGPVPSNS